MKTLSFIIALFVSSFILQAQTLTVTVENVLNENGKVLFSLHTADTFMKGPGIQNAEATIESNLVTVTFENVEPGIYAVMVLHDENENNRMDYQPNGMPKEAYGTSNNSMSFGPPQFAEAKFEMTKEDKEIKIRF